MDYSNEPTGVFLVIDNKSFYATVECAMRGLDPLTTPLVVMSEAANTGGGLILASSPMAKKLFHISNVNRKRDIPNDGCLIVVPPRMNLYIEKNLAVNHIFNQYCADEDLLPYSIDESILDITHSWHLFGNNILQVIRKIQHQVKEEQGLVTTVGLGNNPSRPKLPLISTPSTTKSLSASSRTRRSSKRFGPSPKLPTFGESTAGPRRISPDLVSITWTSLPTATRMN